MNKISIVSDSISQESVSDLIGKLRAQGMEIDYLGTIPTLSEGYSEEIIIEQLKSIIKYNNFPIVAITSSGNSVSIYANKLGVNAAPIFDLQGVDEAISKFSCKIFDIQVNSKNIYSLLKAIESNF